MSKRVIKFRQFLTTEAVPSIGVEKFFYWGFIDNGFIAPVKFNVKSDQFTGLKDKNGKEIYEGDILDFEDGKVMAHHKDVFWVVEWNNDKTTLPAGFVFGKFGMRATYPQYIHPDSNHLIVVGNNYENPELLNE